MPAAARTPAMFVTHGGGPMPLLGEPNHRDLVTFLTSAVASLSIPKPLAILLVSAHWEEDVVGVNTSPAPGMLFDYGGFPPEAYKITYPAPGSPAVAARVVQLLKAAGIKSRQDAQRGYDHGVFVPLKLLYPAADIPVVQISLLRSLNPQAHLELGRALAPLRDEGVMVIGSGATFHNFDAFRQGKPSDKWITPSAAFESYLHTACVDAAPEQRLKLLAAWAAAPGGKQCHPREEHLLPLLVVAGAADGDPGAHVNSWEFPAGLFSSSYLFSAGAQ